MIKLFRKRNKDKDKNKNKDKDVTPIVCVYAGPEELQFGGRDVAEEPVNPEEVVREDGQTYPMQNADPNRLALVYAGPTPKGEAIAWNGVKRNDGMADESMFAGVYAGPGYFAGNNVKWGLGMESDSRFSGVSAGPGSFAGNDDNSAAPGGEVPSETAAVCKICGSKIANPRRFCPECGAVLEKREKGAQ